MADWPKLKRDYVGMRVRSTRELKNGSICIPAGTAMTIEGWYRGASCWAEACPHCGIKIYITKVPQSALEPLEEEDEGNQVD